LGAFAELLEALHELKLEYVPCQGTLIALLRYGTFPAGRLSDGKWDVVDNDAEVMLLLREGEDASIIGRKISLALEARGWPPCTNPHYMKFVCFSLHWAVPCKTEIYFFNTDRQNGIVYKDRTCETPGACTYSKNFPLQFWDGQMPLDVIFPLKPCRLGLAWRHTNCPNKPLDMLRYWNTHAGLGEYERQSLVQPLSEDAGESGTSQSQASEARRADRWCVALPVMSKDRDSGDRRNAHLQQRGLEAEDLRLLWAYARALHRRGFVSFYQHLADWPCHLRQQRILSGETHDGLIAGSEDP